jgi:radical SAM protein with 4Fe4S-binding SPASM domain
MHCKFLTNGVRINEDGTVVPCCEFIGNLGTNISKNFNFAEYFSSKQVIELTEKLSNNEWPEQCLNCAKKEKLKHFSYRQRGNLELTNGLTVDIVIGRECNSDCVMCYSGQSSKIFSRIKKLKPTFDVPKDDLYWISENSDIDYNWVENEEFWNQLKENFVNFDKVKFIGGEPLLSKKLWNWLQDDEIVTQKSKKRLDVVTNGSIFDSNKNHLLTGWQGTNLIVSVDSIENEYEWIRQGLCWEDVSTNVINYSKVEGIFTTIHSTVNLYNVTTLGNLINWSINNNLLITFTPVTSPSLLSIKYAPIHILTQTLNEISNITTTKVQNSIQLKGLKNFLKEAIDNNMENVNLRKSITTYFNNHRKHQMDWETLRCTT